jgi:hypothetical protein
MGSATLCMKTRGGVGAQTWVMQVAQKQHDCLWVPIAPLRHSTPKSSCCGGGGSRRWGWGCGSQHVSGNCVGRVRWAHEPTCWLAGVEGYWHTLQATNSLQLLGREVSKDIKSKGENDICRRIVLRRCRLEVPNQALGLREQGRGHQRGLQGVCQTGYNCGF